MQMLFWITLCLICLLNNVYGEQMPIIQSCASGLTTGNSWSCAAQLAQAVFRLHSWSEDTPINICRNQCHGNLKGQISKLKWKWDGRFRCDSIAPGIVGHDTKQSRNGGRLKIFLIKLFYQVVFNRNNFNVNS